MKLVNAKKLLNDAKLNTYAIGAYNFSNMEQLDAIIKASHDNNCGVIVQASSSAIKYMGLDTCVAMVKAKAKQYNIPVCLNLDHGKDFETCKKAIDAGFTNVMIDGSSLPLSDNILLTKKVVKYAHKKGVTVEAELGALSGIEDELQVKESKFTDPIQAKDFVEKTNVDSLAISIGTSHGAYKFEGSSKLDIKRLKQISNLTKIPLVLHGASSVSKTLVNNYNRLGGNLAGAKGVSNKDLLLAIENGVCKINTDTDLRIAFTIGIKKHLKDNDTFNLRDYLNAAKQENYTLVCEKIKLFTSKKSN